MSLVCVQCGMFGIVTGACTWAIFCDGAWSVSWYGFRMSLADVGGDGEGVRGSGLRSWANRFRFKYLLADLLRAQLRTAEFGLEQISCVV